MYLPEAEETMTDGHKSGHGSCVSSKATGSLFGTAKDADIVMLKVPKELPWTSATLAALVDISDDVERKGIKGKAVVNISLGQRKSRKLPLSVTATIITPLFTILISKLKIIYIRLSYERGVYCRGL